MTNSMTQQWTEELTTYICGNADQMLREPEGQIKWPFTVPAKADSPYYQKDLWDWDSWWISVALAQIDEECGKPLQYMEYEQGNVRNFLDHMDEDGVIPVQMSPERYLEHGDASRAAGFSQNMHKPVLAQQAALLTQRCGSVSWLGDQGVDDIAKFVNRYLESHMHPETGLAIWQTDFAVGVDNDPAVYSRPARSTASIYLNSLLYRELLAMGYLCEEAQRQEESLWWRNRASDLAEAIQRHCWDPRDGTFYSLDVNLEDHDGEDWLHAGAPRSWPGLLLRVDGWSSFMPLWAGIASQEQAERMVQHYRNKASFNARYGVRTLSPQEKMYNLRASNNPSNWLGPVWGISNYMVFHGLVKYGYTDDARDLAEKTVRLFGQDLTRNGALHEYYNPDSGEPIVTKGFQNWNFLVLQMMAFLEGRPMITEF